MLQIKQSRTQSKGMQEAREEVSKMPQKTFFSRIPENLNTEFEIELAKNGLNKQEWFISNVKRFVGKK